VICSIQPQKANREQYGYTIHQQTGVYRSEQVAFNHITLISLNELSDELHNAWITCVASKKLKRLQAFNILKSQGFKFISTPFQRFLIVLWQRLIVLWQRISNIGDDDMALTKLSPQEINEFKKMWLDVLLPTLSLEERLTDVNPSDVMNYFKPEQRLAGINPSNMMNYFKQANLPIEEIEACLEQLKKQS